MNYENTKNPSDSYRYELLKSILKQLNRSEDFSNILKITSIPKEIIEIAQPMKYSNIKIAIIGGGLAGLSSAYELRKLGCEIDIYEANPNRIGGRVNTYYFGENLYGELGAMRVPVSHETTWHYINLFKLTTVPFIYQTENNILYVDKVRIRGVDNDLDVMKYIYPYYDLNYWEKNTPLSKLIEYVYNYVLLQMSRAQRMELSVVRKDYSDTTNFYDALNFYQAAKVLGLTEGAISLLTNIIGIDRGFFYNSYLELIREMYLANFTYLYRIENGLVNLPLAFYNALRNINNYGKVTFYLGNRVKGIYYDYLNKKVILKHNNNYSDYDFVICAVPFSQLRSIDINPAFSTQKMKAIMQVNYENAQKTLLLCNERFWERTINDRRIIGGSSFTDLVIGSIYYPSDRLSNYGVITASYNVGLDATRLGGISDDERFEIIKRELEYVHGLPMYYLDNVVIDYKTRNWACYEYTVGAFSWYTPGQNRLFSYSAYIPEYNNQVFFAGEHISPFHAWMQGALQSGMVAANNVAYELKKL